MRTALESLDGLRRRGRVEPRQGDRVEGDGRADPGLRRPILGPRLRKVGVDRAREDDLVAVAGEARLHEEVDVAVGVGAGDVEADCSPAGAVAKEMLDEAVADVAGLGVPDRVELDDRPLVAMALTLDPQQPAEPALSLVNVHEVVRAERPERQPEEAEHPDRRTAHRQAERAGQGTVVLAQPGQLAESREVGEAGHADGGRPTHRADSVRRVG